MPTFICTITISAAPLPATVEVLQDYVTNYDKVRRLHLIVVDLRPWKYNTLSEPEKLLISCGSLRIVRTRRVSPFRPDGSQPPLRCRGHAFDGSEFPCYLV